MEYQILYGDKSSRFPKALVKKDIIEKWREEMIFSGDASEEGDGLKGWMPETISQRSFLESDVLIAETLARVGKLKRLEGIDDNLLAIVEPLKVNMLIDIESGFTFFVKMKKMQKISYNEEGKMKMEAGPIVIKSDGTINLEDGRVFDIFSSSNIRQKD